MSQNINVAVVGAGYWGPNLVRNFSSLGESCVVRMVCDTRHDRLHHLRHLYPWIETTTNFEDVLNDPRIEAVAIATPIRTHFALTSQCLKAGKHAFVEKPLAGSSAECLELIELAEKSSLTLMVGHTFIYTPAVRYARQVVESGDLGEIYYICSNRLNLGLVQKDINVAWDLAPHDISIILYLLGELPVAVNCQGKSHLGNGMETVTNMSLDFSNRTFATIQSSWMDPNKIRKMTIVGSHRMIVYDDTEPFEKIRIYDKRIEAPPHYDTYAEFQCSYHYGDMRVPFIRQVEPLKVECQHFLDCIRTGERPDTSAEDGLKVVRVLEAASESLRLGGCRIPIAGETEAAGLAVQSTRINGDGD